MSDLEFRMLGPLEVRHRGTRAVVRPGRTRALLALLLVEARRVVGTDVLLEQLWHGEPSATALHALQVYVLNLRKVLEPDRQPGQPWQVLLTRQPGYVLEVAPEASDVGQFEMLVSAGLDALADGRPVDASQLLGEALALWRGPFLAGLGDETFVAAEAARLDELRAMATERWAQAELALGNHVNLVGDLEALIRLHPYHERLWAQLMVALYRSGRTSEALEAYRRLRALLGEEMGLTPGPALQQLETAILRHDPSLAAPAIGVHARSLDSATAEREADVPAMGVPSRLAGEQLVPLAGREFERAMLLRSWKQVEKGGVRVVLIAGEPGIGKTRLATEAALDVHRQGGLVLYGGCEEDLAVPYQPFVEALRHLLINYPQEELAAALFERGGELARLFPELRRRFADLPAPQSADPETERYLLFSAVAELLGKISSRRPTMLILDDLHWATKPTILMLRHVIRSVAPGRLLIVGAYRDSEVDRGHPVTSMVADLWRGPQLERLELGGLSEHHAATMLSTVVGDALGDTRAALARAVHAETGGSPFFMGELIRHIVDAGVLDRMDDSQPVQAELAALGVPDSVRDIVLHRLSRLPEAVEDLLVLAALVGREFDTTLLARLAEIDRSTVVRHLDTARKAALVHEVDGTPGRYLFAHALIRKTLHDQVGPTLRMDLHRRVAEALEALGRADADPAELARHWVAAIPNSAAVIEDAARAARAAQRAARLAMVGLAYEEAITHFEGALKAARQNTDRRWVCHLLIELGEAQRCAGDSAHRRTLLTAGSMAHELHDLERVARAALANQRGVYSRIGDVDVDRVSALRTALEDVGSGDLSLRAKLLSALATEMHFGGDQRLALAREALVLARRAGSEETVAQALSALWFAAWGLVADAERGAIAGELQTVATALTDRSLRFQASLCVFLSATGSGDISRADEALANCEQLAEELGQPVLRWRVTSLQVQRAIISGEFDRAETLARQSLALGELTGQPDRVPFTITPTASMRLLQGRSAEVEAMVTPMLEQFPGVLAFRSLLAWALADAGRHEEAAAILARLRPGKFAGIPRDYGWLFYTSCLSRACYHIGDAGAAAELYELLLTSQGSMATTQASWIGPVTHDLGLLASTLGRYSVAETHFAEAADFQDLIGARVTGVHTRLEWARMLVRQGGRGPARRARTLLVRALGEAREADLPVIEARMVALLTEADGASHSG